MEISRLDAGREAVSVTDVDAPVLVRRIVAARGWSDRVTVDGGPLWLRTDPRRLERVLGNLIANAVQHGTGAVRVRTARAGDRVHVDVDDQGRASPPSTCPACSTASTRSTRPAPAEAAGSVWPLPWRTPDCSAAG